MPPSEGDLRARLAGAGLEPHADALLAHKAPSVRLYPVEEAEPKRSQYFDTPAEVPGLGADAVAIAGSRSHKLALMADGSVMAWGSNERGALGDGTRRDRREPVRVRDLDGVTAIAAGAGHSLALRADGSVLAWGANSWGQLCDGTRTDRRAPVAVRGLDGGVVAIVAGRAMSLALRSDGSVAGWGVNVADKLGIDAIPDRPAQVPGLASGVVAIANEGQYRLALTEDGSVLEWGATAERFAPTPVGGLAAGAVATASGGYHGLALFSDGSLRAWGQNHNGELGDGTTTERSTPVAVTGLGAGVAAIAAEFGCSFAVTVDGAALSWAGTATASSATGPPPTATARPRWPVSAPV